MSDRPSAIYFPLRSNAASLVTGQGVGNVRRRLLLAALLHDQVWIEPGQLIVWAGPDGANQMYLGRRPEGAEAFEWQTPQLRGIVQGSTAYSVIRLTGAPPGSPGLTRTFQATLAWRATFEPFRRELPPGASRWIDFGRVDDPHPAQAFASEWDRDARGDEVLRRQWPDSSRQRSRPQRLPRPSRLRSPALPSTPAPGQGATEFDRRWR